LGPQPVYDAPTELVRISGPHGGTALTWSPDGAYLAAAKEVYVVDDGKASLANTLGVTDAVHALAFSPDGKWLAVATGDPEWLSIKAGDPKLVVFDVPAFTAKFATKPNTPNSSFRDVAWAPDSKVLYAVDRKYVGEKADDFLHNEVRRWSVPGFAEQAAIRSPQTDGYSALAVSPDGRTLAVADGPGGARVIRLLDLGKGTEKSSVQLVPKYTSGGPIRLGFTPDGKILGVFGADNSDPDHPGFATEWRVGLYWWDVATGRPAKPDPARFVIQPASLAGFPAAVSADGTWKALGSESHLPFQWNNKSGAFIRLTKSATGETRTWRVGETSGSLDAPMLAFSPAGRKLAGTVLRRRSGQGGALDSWILIWPVPR
jgi:WD40 repeat protein